MSSYYIGDFIRDTRIRKGYTQEQLCRGVCTSASLSRIENGAQTPGVTTLNCLMQRLGIDDRIFDVFESKKEMQICGMLDEMVCNIAYHEYDKLEENSKKLEELIGEGEAPEHQYLVFAKSILKKVKGAPNEEIMEQLMWAIHMTLPEFDGVTPLETNLLTYNEITIINNIASMHAEKERYEEALALGLWLKHYMEENVNDESEKRSKYPLIVYNLSNWFGRMGKSKDSLREADAGIAFCIEHGCLQLFSVLHFNRGCALAELGDIEGAKKAFCQSTVLFEVTGQEERMTRTVELCKEHYGIEF